MAFLKTIKNMVSARKGEPVIKRFGPYKARFDGQITLDNTAFLLNDQYIQVEDPGTLHQLTHVGTTKVADLLVTRYYLNGITENGETILQVIGTEDRIDEVVLFRQVDTIHPQTEDEWDNIRNMQNEDIFEFNEVGYENVWGSNVAHDETVEASPTLKEETYTYPLETALFKRQISEDNEAELNEFAMVAIEDEERAVVYLGINLLPASVTII